VKVLVTGGAGFIGANAASRYLTRGARVAIVDDLSRPGAPKNLAWLEDQGDLQFHGVDIRDAEGLADVVSEHRDANLILHLAGQVAVTTSVADPRMDFDVNARGTFNLLEAARASGIRAPIIFSSTNKVYGGMEDVGVVARDGQYAYEGLPDGVSEDRKLDFHSPYGCSKGAADQYVRDYHRMYGLNTVVFRQSCIYGYRQFGMEDQGWIAWFTIAAQLGRQITVYGDGMQVRDVLFIDDLVDAFDLAAQHIDRTAGYVYNVGGGPSNVLSLVELLAHISGKLGAHVPVAHDDWRPGDQRVYISDIRLAREHFGWSPKISKEQGLSLLYDWVAANLELFR
jgi:CDP-paratose 2-epimerase